MILVDSNILIDVLDTNQHWRDWSIGRLTILSGAHQLAINQIVLAEVAPRMMSLAHFKGRLATFEIIIEAMPDEAAYVAGAAYLQYRMKVPRLQTVLPDFLIGGHAQTLGATILTRDPRFYRTYFPSVPLITPDEPG